MEEAREVLARLGRIEALRRGGAGPAALLDELRGLVAEAEAWLAAERLDDGRAVDAVHRCREALEGVPALS